MKLGFIGLGIMGSPMAINLARAGHQLHVTTIGPVADELLSLGAVNVETARQVTEFADIIFIMVRIRRRLKRCYLANTVAPKHRFREKPSSI